MSAQGLFDLLGEDADAAAFDHVLFAPGDVQALVVEKADISGVAPAALEKYSVARGFW